MEEYLQNLPAGYQIEGVPAEGAAPPARPLTVHMVPSCSVRLVGSPPPPAASSAFSLAPADSFTELVTSLISPYLVAGDGALLSAESGADLGGESELSPPPADSAAAARPTDCPPQQRELPAAPGRRSLCCGTAFGDRGAAVGDVRGRGAAVGEVRGW